MRDERRVMSDEMPDSAQNPSPEGRGRGGVDLV
jgi:hypothetical protein